MTASRYNTAFSLVELSIVLVILGLLVGGILAGQSLIRASELRSAIADFHRYQSATFAFRDKYFGLPGDITNATLIWGKDTTSTQSCPVGTAGAAGTPGTCNGDGDGIVRIRDSSGAMTYYEGFRFWQHLSLAGMIEGNYNGLAIVGEPFIPGINAPAAKIGNRGIWTSYTYHYDPSAGNVFYLGRQVAGIGQWPLMSLLVPEDAWKIDSKLDDGAPNTGKVRGVIGTAGSGPNCLSGSAYSLSTPTAQCVLIFWQAF